MDGLEKVNTFLGWMALFVNWTECALHGIIVEKKERKPTMTIQLTEKHYALLIRVLEIMASFYGNDFASICKEVGETYGAGEGAIQEACSVLTAVNVTAPVPAMQETAERLLNIAKNPVILPKNQAPYTKQIDIEEDDMIRLVSILDAYSRILMGQFDKIYDAMDVAPDDGEYEHRLQANHDARWYGVGVSEARDLLIPQLKKMGVGWNGSFGMVLPQFSCACQLYESAKRHP